MEKRALSAGPLNGQSTQPLRPNWEMHAQPTSLRLRLESFTFLRAVILWAVRSCRLTGEPCSAAQAFSTQGRCKSLWALDEVVSIITSSIARLTDFQNLIPLVIRPLRLILPSERLRSARIVMLKATHLPLVFLIWAFERLSEARSRNAKVTSFSGPQSPALTRRAPRLPVNSPRLLMASKPNTLGRVQHSSRPHTQTGFVESDAQLKTLVAKLSTQVEELTAMVSQLQEHRQASMPAA